MQLLSVTVQRVNAEMYSCGLVISREHAGFALRCWLCSASADVVMRHVYGALLVAMLFHVVFLPIHHFVTSWALYYPLPSPT